MLKKFETRDLAAAYLHAAQGGQALHMNPFVGHTTATRNVKLAAHLIDYNTDRLILTAKNLGVKVIRVDRLNQRGQHIDLFGKPLKAALAQCKGDEHETVN